MKNYSNFEKTEERVEINSLIYLGVREISPFPELFVMRKNIDLPPSGFTVAFKISSKIPSFA